MSKRILYLIIATVLSMPLFAQDIKNLQDTFLDAEYFFMNENYSDALPFYLQLYERLPDNFYLAYRIGACYLNMPGRKNLSVSYLEAASKNLSAQIKEGTINQKSAPYDALFDLGKAYRCNYMFDKAKECYKKYYQTLLPDDRENLDFVLNEIKVCENAKEIIAKPIEFKEENIGEPFNSSESDFNPVISADGKSFAYMVSMKFYDGIMLSRLVNGKWSSPVNITPELQSDGDFYISCLSADGRLLFLSKDDNYDSDLYFSAFNDTRWSNCLKLNKNINTKYWESHGFISEDGNQLVFASDRPGGFGGLDIYISHKMNGDWGPPVNLGPEINTPFNEERPFLINSGKTLFFSSQGHKNVGGYDIFRSGLQSNGLWSDPVNLGYPLNNADDNFFFMPIGNGHSGYYSIYKEFTGMGKEDIYRITLGEK